MAIPALECVFNVSCSARWPWQDHGMNWWKLLLAGARRAARRLRNRERTGGSRAIPPATGPPSACPTQASNSGHQFGVWAGQLGDGRAHRPGRSRSMAASASEVQFKGAGPHAVFAHGRRPRRTALVDPRVPLLGGDAPPRHPDDARAVCRSARPAGARARRSRRPPSSRAWRRASCASATFEHFYLERPRGRLPEAARRSCDRALLSAVPRSSTTRIWRLLAEAIAAHRQA